MSKKICLEEALNLVKTNDNITFGMTANEPVDFLTNLHKVVYQGITNVTVTTCMPLKEAEYFSNYEYLYHFNMETFFVSAVTRKYDNYGKISFIPNHLHLAGVHRNFAKKTNIFVSAASMPNELGYVSLGLSNVYEMEILKKSDLVILEINPNMPFCHGDHLIKLDDVDYYYETNYKISELKEVAVSEKDEIIGSLIAKEINDGDCIQVGIGGIPNVICKYLENKKDLGVHTEMLTTGIVDLLKKGVVNNSKKQIHPGKTVCCFALGNQELYDYVNNNDNVLVLNGNYVNDPSVIGLNDNQVSINTTMEIDLSGQCCSEAIGHHQFSGTGGQADTAIGAQRSMNGRSFIALYSTAMIKNRENGEKEEISKIVLSLKPGAPVSLSRNDVNYVVSEYGMVNLRGLSKKEKALALISIAHPKFRDELMNDARLNNII